MYVVYFLKKVFLSVKGRFLRKTRPYRGGVVILSRAIKNSLTSHFPNSGNWEPSAMKILGDVEQFHRQLLKLHEIQETYKPLKAFKVNNSSTLKFGSKLSTSFVFHGSDKERNGYTEMYCTLIDELLSFPTEKSIRYVLEIGIGSNNPSIPSNMGAKGSPGASLRAFRDLNSNLIVRGYDIDSRIMFREERIDTHVVNQRFLDSLDAELSEFSNFTFLLIDDGLHSPHANLNSLLCFIRFSKTGSILVIEDIPNRSKEIWLLVHILLDNRKFQCSFFSSNRGGQAFICKNVD